MPTVGNTNDPYDGPFVPGFMHDTKIACPESTQPVKIPLAANEGAHSQNLPDLTLTSREIHEPASVPNASIGLQWTEIGSECCDTAP